MNFTTDIFVRLQVEHLEKKLQVLKQYQSQTSRSYMNERFVRSLLYVHGTQLDVEYAEAFELIRLIY